MLPEFVVQCLDVIGEDMYSDLRMEPGIVAKQVDGDVITLHDCIVSAANWKPSLCS